MRSRVKINRLSSLSSHARQQRLNVAKLIGSGMCSPLHFHAPTGFVRRSPPTVPNVLPAI